MRELTWILCTVMVFDKLRLLPGITNAAGLEMRVSLAAHTISVVSTMWRLRISVASDWCAVLETSRSRLGMKMSVIIQYLSDSG